MILTVVSLLILVAVRSYAQEGSVISGTVSDANKEALVGVNVYIEGTLLGAITNSEGEFSFTTTIKDPIVLVVSCIGFEDVKISGLPSELKDLSVVLKQTSLGIDEAVVVIPMTS